MHRKTRVAGNICTVGNRKKVNLICKREGLNSKKCRSLERRLKKC